MNVEISVTATARRLSLSDSLLTHVATPTPTPTSHTKLQQHHFWKWCWYFFIWKTYKFLSICKKKLTCPSSALKPTKTATPTFIKKISIFFHNFILFILRPKSHEIGHAHNIEKFLNYFSFYSLSISEENYEISRSHSHQLSNGKLVYSIFSCFLYFTLLYFLRSYPAPTELTTKKRVRSLKTSHKSECKKGQGTKVER